jgi:glycosyltransferase involved in cell wall biosynthesis
MKIAIDITPIKGEMTGHKIRGVGFYLTYLQRSLLQYFPDNDYVFFARGEKIDESVDLIHYPYFEPFFVSWPVFSGQKRVITVHDLTPLVFPQHFPAGIKGNFFWQIQKQNLRSSQGILTDSLASQKDIIKIAGIKKENITVAYLAAAEEFKQKENGKWKQALKEKYKLPEKFVLSVGDVTWNKNLPRLIEAAKKKNIPLVMVGKTLVEQNFDRTNPWNKDLITVQQLTEGEKNILKLGFVPTDDLVMLYNYASVFVMPSVYEGFGLPILEAMQSGCPVITTKESSLSEVAGDAAMYVDAYDTMSIADGIEKVFYTKTLQESLVKKGIVQAQKFSWQKTAEQTIAAYKKVL